MSGGRRHQVRGPRSTGADAPAPPSRHLAQARRLQQAAGAIDGDRDQLRAFEASPDDFMARFGLDAVQLGASAESVQAGGAVDGLVVAPSSIHGVGVHTQDPIAAGTKLYDGASEGKMSRPLAKTNRSDDPNATFVVRGDGQMDVVTLSAIDPGQEILIDYPRDNEVPAGSPGMGGNYDP